MNEAVKIKYDEKDRLDRIAHLRANVPNFSELLTEFVIPRVGWELDNYGWVVRLTDGSVEVWDTNHGSLYKTDVAALRETIAETGAALDSQRTALGLLLAIAMEAREGGDA